MSSAVSGARPQLSFYDHNDGLNVTIDTEHLHIRSVEPGDIEAYAALFGNQGVMEKYGDGQPQERDRVAARINTWVRRWQQKDPYSALAIFTKGQEFVGHIVLGYGDAPGTSEIAGLGYEKFWGKGYGKEAATAVIQHYAPALVREGYLLEGRPLKTIVATAREDNVASNRILEEMGMRVVRQEQKYGAIRNVYSLDVAGVQKEVAEKVTRAWCTLL